MAFQVNDIARIFLSRGPMTHKKLQKLCYYAQAWHFYYYNKPLMETEFQAWIHGPVSPQLYDHYRRYGYDEIPRVEKSGVLELDRHTLSVINAVYMVYGNYSGDELETRTHSETPWLEARANTPPHRISHAKISCDLMIEFCRNAMNQNTADF